MKQALLVAAILAILYGAGWQMTRPKGSDEEQIRQVLEKGRNAVEAKDVKTALSCLSDKYSGEGGRKDQVRLLLMKALRDVGAIKVVVQSPQTTVNGDQAEVKTSIRVSWNNGAGASFQDSSAVNLHFARENRKELFIFPVKKWLITSFESKTGIENL